jgi:hypothetical protein
MSTTEFLDYLARHETTRELSTSLAATIESRRAAGAPATTTADAA